MSSKIALTNVNSTYQYLSRAIYHLNIRRWRIILIISFENKAQKFLANSLPKGGTFTMALAKGMQLKLFLMFFRHFLHAPNEFRD